MGIIMKDQKNYHMRIEAQETRIVVGAFARFVPLVLIGAAALSALGDCALTLGGKAVHQQHLVTVPRPVRSAVDFSAEVQKARRMAAKVLATRPAAAATDAQKRSNNLTNRLNKNPSAYANPGLQRLDWN
jgi:hypothetical protein